MKRVPIGLKKETVEVFEGRDEVDGWESKDKCARREES